MEKNSKSPMIWGLILIGFAMIEVPCIFFINRMHPMILGMPFIYGFVIIVWAYLCIVLFYAYKVNWGKKKIK